MKKTLCLLIVLALFLTGTAFSETSPEETAAPESTPAASASPVPEPTVAAFQGERVDIDSQFSLRVPSNLQTIELESEDEVGGVLYSAYNETMGFDIYTYNSEGDTLDTLYTEYQSDGSTQEVTLAEIGGIRVLVYKFDDETVGATLMGENGYLYELLFTFETTEEYQTVGAILASIEKVSA